MSTSEKVQGTVISIHTAPTPGAPVVSVDAVHAVPGKGLEGDRYFRRASAFSKSKLMPEYEITLIEAEAIEAFSREYGIEFKPGDARRNLVTHGVRLNELLGHEIAVGEVTLRVIRLCDPCSHLAKVAHPNVLPGLVHRGGLRARILNEGTIRVGDPIRKR